VIACDRRTGGFIRDNCATSCAAHCVSARVRATPKAAATDGPTGANRGTG
jgi:hypothetical protein